MAFDAPVRCLVHVIWDLHGCNLATGPLPPCLKVRGFRPRSARREQITGAQTDLMNPSNFRVSTPRHWAHE